jgi:hypothetical protein
MLFVQLYRLRTTARSLGDELETLRKYGRPVGLLYMDAKLLRFPTTTRVWGRFLLTPGARLRARFH